MQTLRPELGNVGAIRGVSTDGNGLEDNKMSVIQVEGLQKYYGEIKAVDGISFEVRQGEVFGFLGPNGAGKTTTIEIIEGFRKADAGQVTVLGLDPGRESYEIKERIGITLQETALYENLRVDEILKLFASYYQSPADTERLLEMIGLEEKRRSFIRELSGGQKQRVVFVLSLINDPELLFLDEPTAGLDPQSRRAIWNWIGRAKQEGKAVFLTTHYIDEAEALCDRVAILDHGKIIALDTPKRLMANAEAEQKITFVVDGHLDITRLESMPVVSQILDEGHGEYTIYAPEVQPVLKALILQAESNGFALRGLTIEGSTLEDVFIQLTGRRIRA
jgi:ABC-2 type transport system ATP-binding protein